MILWQAVVRIYRNINEPPDEIYYSTEVFESKEDAKLHGEELALVFDKQPLSTKYDAEPVILKTDR